MNGIDISTDASDAGEAGQAETPVRSITPDRTELPERAKMPRHTKTARRQVPPMNVVGAGVLVGSGSAAVLVRAFAAYAFQIEINAERIDIIVDKHHQDARDDEDPYRIVRKMYASSSSGFLELAKSPCRGQR